MADYLNFSKASSILKITQPAVSHQIQTLEEELGVKLFNRTSKNVSLTQEGMLFIADAKLILKTAKSAKKRLGEHKEFIPFEVGCHNYLEMNLLPSVLKKLAEEFPLLRPTLHFVPFPSLLGLVENGQIHAAFGTKDEQKDSSLYFKELCTVPMACICSPDHPLANYQTLTKRQLSGSFIACAPRHLSDAVFTIQNNVLLNQPLDQRFLTESIESALALAKAGLGYTLYPDIPMSREPGLRYIPVTTLPKMSFGIYCRSDRSHPVLKEFLGLMGQSFSQR